MKTKIEIKMDSAAFDETPATELARILRHLADEIESGHVEEGTGAGLRDINGNTVGKFEVLS